MVSKRVSAKRISIVNHKGGVGKTTLTFNIAAELASRGKRVLLVDADPQCNLTAYVIEGNVLDDMLDNSDKPGGSTLWSAIKPVMESTGPPLQIKPIDLFSKMLLLPGDIRLSDFEEELSDDWRQCFQRKRRGFVGTTALSSLINTICKQRSIEYVFYDSGPNIGPLNRVILLDCDYFIIPAAYDLFSVRALKTLGRTLHTWISDWRTIQALAPDNTYLMPGRPQFLGYIPQRFSMYRGGVISKQQKYASLLENSIKTEIVAVLKEVGAVKTQPTYRLGEVKDFANLVAVSHREGLPLDKVSGVPADQRKKAKDAFSALVDRMLKSM